MNVLYLIGFVVMLSVVLGIVAISIGEGKDIETLTFIGGIMMLTPLGILAIAALVELGWFAFTGGPLTL